MSMGPSEMAVLRLAVDDYWGLWEIRPEIAGTILVLRPQISTRPDSSFTK